MSVTDYRVSELRYQDVRVSELFNTLTIRTESSDPLMSIKMLE